MQTKLKVRIIKYNKNLFYIVVGLNKRSIHSRYMDKLGVCFFRKKKKIIMLSLKKLSFWLNKGVKISNFVSYIFSIIFFYYVKNRKKNKLIFENYKFFKKKNFIYNDRIKKYLKGKKNTIL